MVLMTPERTARLETVNAEIQLHSRTLRGFGGNTDADYEAARAALAVLKPELETLSVMAGIDQKLAEITPFIGMYQTLKPEAVALLALGVDEVLDILIQVANSVTKYDEFRALQAEAYFKTYQSFVTAGFNESQAFALTVRSLEIFDEALKRNISGIKVNTKS